jgi:hypothetical protein
MSRFIELLDKIEAILLLPISKETLLFARDPEPWRLAQRMLAWRWAPVRVPRAFVEDKALFCLMTQRTHVGAALKASNRHANVLDCLD